MKNKVLIAIAAVFVVVAFVVTMVFVFGGGPVEQPERTLDLTGTWKVTGQTAAGTVTLSENEFYVFTEDTASNFRDGSTTPYATSSYTLKPGDYPDFDMSLPELGMDMVVSPCTENLVRLYTNASLYIHLFRYPNADFAPIELDESVLEGRWDVAYRNLGDVTMVEQLVFENGELRDYRNNAAEPSIVADYTFNEAGNLCAQSIGMELRVCPCSEDLVFLVEVDTGFVWELHRVK